MSYNGWKNYETWCAALWIDNDEGSYHYRVELADTAWEESEDAPQVEEGTWSRSEAARFILEDRLREWVEEMRPEVEGMFGDLLGAALGEIDWLEVADNWLEDDYDGYVGRDAPAEVDA